MLGSGGHTTEMIKMLRSLDREVYKPRLYFIAETDHFSEQKIRELESEDDDSYQVVRIPRSREVGQSYVSSVVTTLVSSLHCLLPLLEHQPQLVLVNGPGTCLPSALISWSLSVLRLSRCRIMFVESVCRVKTLSLTGRILQHIADDVLVQWPELAEKYQKTKYIGKFL